MTLREILLIGDPQLYEVSTEVLPSEFDTISSIVQDLHDTIMNFKTRNGFGRAIAAPQIGVMKRIIYMFIDRPVVFVNPVLRNMSGEMIEVWDDCFSIPNFLIKVKRHQSLTIEYLDENGDPQERKLENDLSELLQHEYDHLDGILATSRAIDTQSFAYRKQIK